MFRNRLICILAAFLITGTLTGHAHAEGLQRKRVGLVLSGGGAKGVAHISAIKVLEEAGIPIDYIAGTSMGAIIGGLYAIGYDTHTLDSMVRSQDWALLLSDRVSRRNQSFGAREADDKFLLTIPLNSEKKLRLPSGLVGGYSVYNLLYELTINYHDSISFNNLPIPFACVAFDMASGNTIVMREGYLPDAIRASMSIPGAFQPVRKEGMVLVDGGISDNFPADVVREMGAEIIIGIDVTSGLKDGEEIKTLTDIVEQLTGFMAVDAYEKNMQLVDFYVHPDIENYSAASFSAQAIDTLLVRGETAVREKWDELMELKELIGVPRDSRPAPRHHAQLNKTLLIGQVTFEGLRTQLERPLRKVIGIRENSIITTDELHEAVSKLQGTGALADVHYRLEGHSPYDLVFMVREKSMNSLSFGFRFDTDEMAAVLLSAKLTARNLSNTHFEITTKLGYNPYVRGSLIVGGETKPQLNISLMYQYNDINLYHRGRKVDNLDFNRYHADVNFSNINLRDFKLDLGINYNYYDYRSVLSIREESSTIKSEGILSYYVRSRVETLDSKYYARKGFMLTAEASMLTSNFIQYKGGAPFGAISVTYLTALSPSKRVSFLPGIYGRVLIGNKTGFPMRNFMGGPIFGRYVPQQMPFTGIHNLEYFHNAVVAVKLDFRVRLWMKNYVSLKTNYAKHNDDLFKLFEGDDIYGIGLGYSYNSIVGPLDLLIEWSNYTKKAGFYISLGYYF